MKFKCKCGRIMDEIVHFDYGSGLYEIRLECTCRKSSQHIHVNLGNVKAKLITEMQESYIENYR